MTQSVMVIEILVAERDGIQALPQQVANAVGTAAAPPAIHQPARHCLAQADALIDLAQQQHTGVAGDLTPGEIGLHTATGNGWKIQRILVAFCHGGSSCY